MGGGFYDRTLQNWQNKSFIPVGLAHPMSASENLPTEHWDINLLFDDILVGLKPIIKILLIDKIKKYLQFSIEILPNDLT